MAGTGKEDDPKLAAGESDRGESRLAPGASSSRRSRGAGGAETALEPLRRVVSSKLGDERLQATLQRGLATVRGRMEKFRTHLADPEAARALVGEIRHRNVGRLKENLEELEKRLVEAGTQVLWARDAAEARELVAGIARSVSARTAVASKTMVGEEIGLEEALREVPCRLLQTDLGERIVQLAGQSPSHITAPCLHMDAAQVGEILKREAGMAHAQDAEDMCRFVAAALRPEFLSAQIAFSGANMAIVETGELVIVENEGNGRAGFSLAPVHVALVGIEKVVRSRQEAACVLSLLPGGATGQDATVYASFIPAEPEAGRKRFVIFVDNGRSDVFAAGPHRELLRCIRCGACLNVCPVYERVSGHAYSWTYSGPIGIALAPFMGPPVARCTDTDLCTLCGACTEVCPAHIPLDRLIALARRTSNSLRPKAEQKKAQRMARWYARAMSGPGAFGLSHLGHRLATRFRKTLSRIESAAGWGEERAAPKPARRLFRSMFRQGRRKGRWPL